MRKLLFIAALAAGAVLVLGGSASAGLMHYWSCDVADDDPGGNLKDTARSYTIGTVGETDYAAAPMGSRSTNPATRGPGATGIADSAVQITGSASTGGTAGYKTALLDMGTVFTWEMMVKWDGRGYNWSYFTDRAGGPIRVVAGSSSKGYVFNPEIGGVGLLGNSWNPTLGLWYHLAIVADGTTVSLYATEQGQPLNLEMAYASTTPAVHATEGLAIGNPDDSRYAAVGYVDWVAVWDQALTPAELAQHVLDNGLDLTEIVIPEPAGLGLLGVALLAMRKRR